MHVHLLLASAARKNDGKLRSQGGGERLRMADCHMADGGHQLPAAGWDCARGSVGWGGSAAVKGGGNSWREAI